MFNRFPNAYALFPVDFVRQSVETYTKDHGKAPTVICISSEDYVQWVLSNTIAQAYQFDLEVVVGEYLKPGQIDLGSGIAEGNNEDQE